MSRPVVGRPLEGDIHALGAASSVGIMRMVTRDTRDTWPLFPRSLSLVAVCWSVSPHIDEACVRTCLYCLFEGRSYVKSRCCHLERHLFMVVAAHCHAHIKPFG